MAVQVVSGGVEPLTVKVAGVASEALAEAGETLPVVQERLTVTEAALSGTKSLWTVNWALLRVLVMVQVPALRRALQVPVEV